MAKPLICKIALAQISVNPAYADELVSWIQEPTFPGENDKIGLFSISGLEEIAHLQKNIGEKYIAHLNRKIETIVRFASAHQVELLVLPEYSIPPETLPLCYSLAEELGIAIIAGSHVMTLSEAARQIYRDLEIQFKGETAVTEQRVRQAACIVFLPKEKPLGFVKSYFCYRTALDCFKSAHFGALSSSVEAGVVLRAAILNARSIHPSLGKGTMRGSPNGIVRIANPASYLLAPNGAQPSIGKVASGRAEPQPCGRQRILLPGL